MSQRPPPAKAPVPSGSGMEGDAVPARGLGTGTDGAHGDLEGSSQPGAGGSQGRLQDDQANEAPLKAPRRLCVGLSCARAVCLTAACLEF